MPLAAFEVRRNNTHGICLINRGGVSPSTVVDFFTPQQFRDTIADFLDLLDHVETHNQASTPATGDTA